MLVRKTNPVGIDKVIDDIQVHLDGVGFVNYGNYPRAYKNPSRFDDRGYIPEIYNDNGDYKEVFYDDTLWISSFFVVGDRREVGTGKATAPISLIVQANLKQIFPAITHRADEEINNLFWDRLKTFTKGAKVESIETAIENVYREFVRENVKFDDLGKYYVVRFNLQAVFESQCCDNCLNFNT